MFALGTTVVFGRPNGQQHTGVVVKTNAKSIKIRHAVTGVEWRCHPNLVRAIDGSAPAMPAPVARPAPVIPFKVGDRVTWNYRGMDYKGTVLRVSTRTCGVRDELAGLQWRIGPNQLKLVDGYGDVVTTAPKRPEDVIMGEILNCYSGMEPENISCDGEASITQQRLTLYRLRASLRTLFVELGRPVTEDQAWAWHAKQPNKFGG
jgi:hypothetical protein